MKGVVMRTLWILKAVLIFSPLLWSNLLLSQPRGCLAPIDEISPMFLNPTNVNNVFSFDYRIDSEVNTFFYDDLSPTYRELSLNYYVNSADGSLYMTEGFVNILLLSAGMSLADIILDPIGKIEGMLRLPNGQQVLLVLDRKSGIKRAIVLESNLSPFNLYRVQGERLDKYIDEVLNMNEIEYGGRTSEASDMIMQDYLWGGRGGLTQLKGFWEIDSYNSKYEVIMQIANNPNIESIPTNTPLVGLLTGIMKSKRSPCNYLVVETIISQIDEDAGNDVASFVSETMINISKQHKTVDTAEYQIMRIESGIPRSEEERENIFESQEDYQRKLGLLIDQMEACGNNHHCIARVNTEIIELQRSFELQKYDSAPSDLTETQGREKVLMDNMYMMHRKINEVDERCKDLDRANARCGGCLDIAYTNCKQRLQGLKDHLQRMECQLAHLRGMADLMEECN